MKCPVTSWRCGDNSCNPHDCMEEKCAWYCTLYEKCSIYVLANEQIKRRIGDDQEEKKAE